ncbi:Zinc finger, C2H2 [Artemisia annua]|uniref:Zinc finger, C2H2 n=1 Tax=Artemisia annua TaxID=35608 RepID=A0A2U1QNX2_ARTAN|nr:Zinc finger, C2H2 [Artemisia annua]
MGRGSRSRKDPVTSHVVAVSPDRLLDVKKYVCETCYKGFVREQNLQLHRRAHNLPFTLRRNSSNETKKVYLCPESTCIYHNPAHAIGDLGGLKKHYLRKHVTEKKHKCDTCSKAYAVEVDLKVHLKTCGKKKHKCSCGMKFKKKYELNIHMDHYYSGRRLNGATNHSSRNDMGNNSANVTRNNNNGSFMISSTFTYPPTFNMEHNSDRITINQNNKTLAPQISSVQTTFNPYPTISPYEYQLYDIVANQGSLMTNHSMGLNSGQTLYASYFPSIQQNQQDSQDKFGEWSYMQMLMGNNVSVDNFEVDNNFNGGSYYTPEGSDSYIIQNFHNTSLNAMMDNGYGGGAGSFNQAYGQGYCG